MYSQVGNVITIVTGEERGRRREIGTPPITLQPSPVPRQSVGVSEMAISGTGDMRTGPPRDSVAPATMTRRPPAPSVA